MGQNRYQSVEEYLEHFPEQMQAALQEMRMLVKGASSLPVEQVSRGKIAYFFHGVVVQFTGEADFVRLVTSPAAVRQFRKDLKGYQIEERDTVCFPIEKPFPEKLIRELVAFRIRENSDRHVEEVLGRRRL